jgi:hypothetical protein
MNKNMILGILLVMAGTGIVDYFIAKHIERTIALPNQLFGFALVIIGAVFIHKGKKQQIEDRKRNQE